jgi:hypothetical protein
LTTFTAVVELFVAGAWLDITKLDEQTKVLAAGGITITRGRSDQQGRVAPTEVRFTYLDNGALLDGDNPASPYYRMVGLGTPMRVKVDGEVRAVVEVVSWEPSWDDIDSVVMVSVVGAGILRRLEDGEKPLRSAAYRALTSPVNDAERVIYIPFEEESGATMVSSPYPGPRVHWTGTVNFGAVTDSLSSARLLQFGPATQFGNTHLFVNLPTWTNTAEQHMVAATLRFPETEIGNNAVIYCMYFTGGTIDVIHLAYQTGGFLYLQALTNGVVVDTFALEDWGQYILDEEVLLVVDTDQDGADVDVRIRVTNFEAWLATFADTMTGQTLGRMWAITISQTSVEGLGFGQLAIGSSKDSFDNYLDDLDADENVVVTGARGYQNERAGARIARLADEESIPITVVGDAAFSERLGTQGLQTAPEMIYTGLDTDMGILFETRDALELTYRTRASLHNQVPSASLSYGHLSKGFRPTSDDLRVVNAVTAQRNGGGSGYYQIPDGDPWHWTTQDPPDGAGLREAAETTGVATDDQLVGQAAWRAHIGAWREKRFRQVVFELAHPNFDAADRAAVRALDIGAVLAVDTVGSPAYVPYSQIRLMVQGYTETVSKFLHTFAFNTTPADVYEVEVTDSGGSTSVVAVDDNDTSLKLATTLGREWSTADEPYHIAVAGQPMTVTAMVTDTPAFINAGTVAHANNATVTPGLPAGMTADVGQLMLAWVAIRNSGGGTVDEHGGGWTTLADIVNANVKLFYRYYAAGDTAPTFGFSGGVANADTSARIFGFSGLSHGIASGAKADPDWTHQLNGSAQNVAYPALNVNRDGSVALIFVWKQDDSTGYTPPSGFTEMADNSTTTGDDQSIAAYYDLTAVSAVAGTVTVGGGASAVSRALVLALRPLQTATVTRGIAGVATSAAAGSDVHVWRPGVNGL